MIKHSVCVSWANAWIYKLVCIESFINVTYSNLIICFWLVEMEFIFASRKNCIERRNWEKTFFYVIANKENIFQINNLPSKEVKRSNKTRTFLITLKWDLSNSSILPRWGFIVLSYFLHSRKCCNNAHGHFSRNSSIENSFTEIKLSVRHFWYANQIYDFKNLNCRWQQTWKYQSKPPILATFLI